MSTWIDSFVLWLIVKLAGKRIVVLNAALNPRAPCMWQEGSCPDGAVLSPKYDVPSGIVHNCTFHASATEQAGAGQ